MQYICFYFPVDENYIKKSVQSAMDNDSDGVTFVAFLTGTHVAAKTRIHPPIKINDTSSHGRINQRLVPPKMFGKWHNGMRGPPMHHLSFPEVKSKRFLQSCS